MVVSGVPERSKYHAEHVADLALDMISAMPTLVDPSKSSPHLRIRVGKEILLSCPVYRKYKCNLDSTVLLTVGSLNNNDSDGYKNGTKKWSRAASKFMALIQSRPIRQMLAIFLELNSKTEWNFRNSKGERKSLSCVHKTWNLAFSRHSSRAVTEKKCTKKRGTPSKLLFCQTKPKAPFSLTSPSLLLKLPNVTVMLPFS